MSLKRTKVAAALRQRIFSQLHLGLLKPGTKLPSVRNLATEFGVDPRVVLRAFGELEREGLVELRPRSGIYFAPPPAVAGAELPAQAEWAIDVLVQGLGRGIPARQFADRVHTLLATLRLRVACIECNSDQTSALSQELEADYGLETDELNVDDLLADDTPRSELRRADLLVTTHFHATEVQSIAERAGKPWMTISLRTDILAAIAQLLPVGLVYFVVVDERYAEKLAKIFTLTVGSPNLRTLVLGRDTVSVIPDTAPVYITTAAHARLDDERLLSRVMPESRAFSAASARDILTFMVRANTAAAGALERR